MIWTFSRVISIWYSTIIWNTRRAWISTVSLTFFDFKLHSSSFFFFFEETRWPFIEEYKFCDPADAALRVLIFFYSSSQSLIIK
jgi:hypothetical protein